jgi:hypothetical protein
MTSFENEIFVNYGANAASEVPQDRDSAGANSHWGKRAKQRAN